MISILGGYGGLERTTFWRFSQWDGEVVLKGMILNNFCYWQVLWSWTNSFGWFSFWKAGVVWKGLILDDFHFGRCANLERANVLQVFILGEWDERIKFRQILHFRYVWWSSNKQFLMIFTLEGWSGLILDNFHFCKMQHLVVLRRQSWNGRPPGGNNERRGCKVLVSWGKALMNQYRYT